MSVSGHFQLFLRPLGSSFYGGGNYSDAGGRTGSPSRVAHPGRRGRTGQAARAAVALAGLALTPTEVPWLEDRTLHQPAQRLPRRGYAFRQARPQLLGRSHPRCNPDLTRMRSVRRTLAAEAQYFCWCTRQPIACPVHGGQCVRNPWQMQRNVLRLCHEYPRTSIVITLAQCSNSYLSSWLPSTGNQVKR